MLKNTSLKEESVYNLDFAISKVEIYENQRKVIDTTRYLNVERPYLMNLCNSRMELLFWSNIDDLPFDEKIFKESISLEKFNCVIQG